MRLDRRRFLHLAGLIAASAGMSGCLRLHDRAAAALSAPLSWPPQALDHFHALNRFTFGPRADERIRVAEIGLQAWLEEQLDPLSLQETDALLRLRRFNTLSMSANDLADLGDKLFDDVDTASVPNELRQATLLRQVYSRRQLYERMVEFWTDHFSISVEKNDCWFLKTVDDREVIRAHALGYFGDLLQASAHSPAMLVYLDNQANRKGSPNENYARELLELHTLGVNGGYTQDDVMELARCLTGWTVKEHFWRGEFTFDAGQHDVGPKEVLGMHIAPAGQKEAEQILEMLPGHPSTAQHIVTKLAHRFLGEPAPVQAIARGTATFAQTGGDIRSVLRAMLLDHADDLGPKYKRPVNFVVSALRMLNAQTDGGLPLLRYLTQMGQLPFGWPTPDGYPDDNAGWQGGLLPRWQFALELAQNRLPGTEVDYAELAQAAAAGSPASMLDKMSTLLLGAQMPSNRRHPLLAIVQQTGAAEDDVLPAIVAGLVASPAFQWH